MENFQKPHFETEKEAFDHVIGMLFTNTVELEYFTGISNEVIVDEIDRNKGWALNRCQSEKDVNFLIDRMNHLIRYDGFFDESHSQDIQKLIDDARADDFKKILGNMMNRRVIFLSQIGFLILVPDYIQKIDEIKHIYIECFLGLNSLQEKLTGENFIDYLFNT